MTEINYHYVKGKGWIPSYGTYIMSCGTAVRVECRFPEPDEHYWSVHDDSMVGVEFPDFEGRVKWVLDNIGYHALMTFKPSRQRAGTHFYVFTKV